MSGQHQNSKSPKAVEQRLFKANPKPYTSGSLQFDDLSMADLIDIGRVAGVKSGELQTWLSEENLTNLHPTSLKVIAAMLWVTERKIDPEFSYKDAANQPIKVLMSAIAPEESAEQSEQL